MKKYLKMLIMSVILIVFTTVVILDNATFSFAEEEFFGAEIVLERDSLRVLEGVNVDAKLSNASTTKIVTAITVIENCDLDNEVVITKESVGVEGSSIYLKEGDVLSVRELLYGLMLRSGNDAATALALHVGGSIENFASMMNTLSYKCGAINSNFVNPHGLYDANHYTTAKDLALICAYALRNETFAEIVRTKKIAFGSRTFLNKNKMLFNYDGADGVKTGYTKKAGRCLVSSATKNGMQLICVILNYPKTYERTTELFDRCFSKYSLTEVVKKGEIIAKIPVKDAVELNTEYSVSLNQSLYLPITFEEKKSLKIEFLSTEFLIEPINKGEYLGILSITTDKDLIFSSKLYTINTNEKREFFKTLVGVLARWRVYAYK